MDKAIIVLQTDFTYMEGAVASMYGVIKSVDSSLQIYDATHEIPHFDTWSASYRLIQYVRFWPKGTVFVSVVDPGVGTMRRASLAVTTDGYYILSPDNGTFYHLLKEKKIEKIYEIDIEKHRLRGYSTDNVSVFHGRDVFSYVAAKLASLQLKADEVGPSYPLEEIVGFNEQDAYIEDSTIYGYIEIADPNFGNLWTNIPIKLFHEAEYIYGSMISVEISCNKNVLFCKKLPFEASFGYVEIGELVIYQNEMNRIALAISRGNLVQEYKLGFGPEWEVRFWI